ncbi:hypothetical protein [Nitrosomonas communis]|uniref:hypothetical protein n=1 Tax=Nitrosomonas communis TaxID=44574 RepID=UPI00094524B6|nr:hypothetical protein [Nitrosomonas communis]
MDIEIPPMVDYPSYRSLIAMKRRGTCLKLIAIDGGKLNVNRGGWMAERLAKQISQAPILALLGDLHSLKRVDWHTSVIKAPPYIAEILVPQAHQIKSYQQSGSLNFIKLKIESFLLMSRKQLV